MHALTGIACFFSWTRRPRFVQGAALAEIKASIGFTSKMSSSRKKDAVLNTIWIQAKYRCCAALCRGWTSRLWAGPACTTVSGPPIGGSLWIGVGPPVARSPILWSFLWSDSVYCLNRKLYISAIDVYSIRQRSIVSFPLLHLKTFASLLLIGSFNSLDSLFHHSNPMRIGVLRG